MKKPNTCTNLIKAINAIAHGRDPVRLARAMANVIIGQILPDGVVKGGSSLMFRYGENCTRYTRDIDTARVADLDSYIARLGDALRTGWCGFSGVIIPVDPPSPEGVPDGYVMIPFDIKLSYCGRAWQTVRIEIGHNEIGDADMAESALPTEMAEAFETLGFAKPKPLPVMKLSYQIAQKLHAVSSPGSDRAHDLIDLQLIMSHSTPDLREAKSVCERLFNYRKQQAWPPSVQKGVDWESLYQAAFATIRDAESIASTVDEAISWANDFISKIAKA